MWLQRQLEHRGYDILSQTTTKKCIEQHRPLYMVFVDFSKAFNTVGRTGLWQLLRKYGCPEKFTTMIEALHIGIMAIVSVGGEVSESFRVTNGVKQDCVLAPTLFSIFLSAMLDEAFRDMGDSIYIQSRLIQRRTLQSKDQDYSDIDERAAIRR